MKVLVCCDDLVAVDLKVPDCRCSESEDCNAQMIAASRADRRPPEWQAYLEPEPGLYRPVAARRISVVADRNVDLSVFGWTLVDLYKKDHFLVVWNRP